MALKSVVEALGPPEARAFVEALRNVLDVLILEAGRAGAPHTDIRAAAERFAAAQAGGRWHDGCQIGLELLVTLTKGIHDANDADGTDVVGADSGDRLPRKRPRGENDGR